MSDRTPQSRPRTVPQSRVGRFARLSGTAGGIAGTMALNGIGHLARGERPELRDLLLTPANMGRLADQLARMRGAAMKVGQLMSMDAGDVLPEELSDVLARLRADADHMPPRQLRRVLNGAWGEGWLKQFRSFNVRPIAAASIGQVHRAETRDGRDLAIKIQYPGVARSIDSDVTNLGTLLGVSGLIPKGLDMEPLLAEARRQLHEEADYRREARCMEAFGRLLSERGAFEVPQTAADLSTDSILAMSFLPGQSIESLADHPQALKDEVMEHLIELLFLELFAFGQMQTDPNFANYRYNPETGKILLLDFGATREFGSETVSGYRGLLEAGLSGDRRALDEAAIAIGFYASDTAPHHRKAVLDMIDLAFEALRGLGAYDFGTSDIALRLRDRGMELSQDRSFIHMPPMDVFYLQRKFAGMFLLASRLGARVRVRHLLESALAENPQT